jgi:hypothetical protein
MFAHVETKCTLSTNETCGFHVHMSPGNDEPWSVAELGSISFAIIHFEEAVLALLPEHRRNNMRLGSNFVDNKQFSGLTKNEC